MRVLVIEDDEKIQAFVSKGLRQDGHTVDTASSGKDGLTFWESNRYDAVVLDIMAHVLTPKMQAYSYDEGYLYPGPAVKDVPLSLAPKRSQEVIAEFGRPEYADLIAKNPIELPLKPDKMVVAFRKWDELVGAKRKR